MPIRADIAVAGAGAVGLACAIGCAQAGYRTVLVGPDAIRRDGRTAAVMQRSWGLLERLGVADELRAAGAELRRLTIVDDTDNLFRPAPVTFEAEEIGESVFGWNIENATIVEILARAAEATPGLAWLREPAGSFDGFGPEARLVAGNGEEILARLVVAADGRRSQLRTEAGIGVSDEPYNQVAFTTLLRHTRDHESTSTEFHRRTGPFTLVPLQGRRSSLVWVTIPAHAKRLMAASADHVAEAVAAASHGILGDVTVDGPRGFAPLATLLAKSLVAPRLALVGEAAHALPPIGAQGLNLGFADVQALIETLAATERRGGDPGAPEALDAYAQARRTDLAVRAKAVDMLNRALLSTFAPVDALRGLGLGLLGEVGALRRTAMRTGLGARRTGVAPRAA